MLETAPSATLSGKRSATKADETHFKSTSHVTVEWETAARHTPVLDVTASQIRRRARERERLALFRFLDQVLTPNTSLYDTLVEEVNECSDAFMSSDAFNSLAEARETLKRHLEECEREERAHKRVRFDDQSNSTIETPTDSDEL